MSTDDLLTIVGAIVAIGLTFMVLGLVLAGG